jgi:prepilin-type N-terminal cleavage/methylation domain-containing protein
MHRPSRLRFAFTLIELLVVISIIALLIAILLPALGSARQSARSLACQSNVRNIGTCFVAYSVDHKDRLPATGKNFGGNANMIGPAPDDRSWIGREAWPGVNHDGVILDYLSSTGASVAVNGQEGDVAIYRCAELQAGGGTKGVGSNGRFDYMGAYQFTGASVDRVPLECEYKLPGTNWNNGAIDAYTPLVLEEDPIYYAGGNTDPGHANADRMSTIHPNLTSNYFTVDGSVHLYTASEEGRGSVARDDWRIKGPSGRFYTLNYHENNKSQRVWGSWDHK